MARISLALAVALGMLVSVVPATLSVAAGDGITINEIRIDQPSTDNDEYFELSGSASASLDGLTYLVIGDGTGGSGVIEAVVDLSGQALDANGLFVVAESSFSLGTADMVETLNFENSDNVTHLLVGGFTGANGDDLDTNDDGVLDATPWETELDRVALIEEANPPSATEYHYGPPIVGPDGSFVPGHVYDCDTWQIGAFDPVGGDDTPGAANICDAEPPPPTSSGLTVNEIDYDQPSTDTAEFVEVYNGGAAAVDLTGLQLRFVNGANDLVYDTIALSGTLSAGDFFVVCANAATTPNCDLDDGPDTNFIQNGAPDAIALVETATDTIVDTVSYEGDTAAPYTEGTGAVADPGNGAFVSISRTPDGADTDDNSADFSLVCTTPGTANASTDADCTDPSPPPPPVDPLELEIYQVQGSGASSPHDGQVVTVDGVVVGDFQGNAFAGDQLDGFHLQEAVGDGDATTSDGIFVHAPGAEDVAVGDVVEVTGTVDEFFGLTEITDVTALAKTGTGSVAPTPVSLPVTAQSDWEPFEGMLVTFDQDLYISEFFNFDRFNEIVLTTDRQFQGTQVTEPGPSAIAVGEANALARITLDDGRTIQNPDPAIHPDGTEFTLNNTFRGGDILQEVTGVVDFAFGLYRIQPTTGAIHVVDNPRSTSPEAIGGDLRVATFNVLNFFTHLDNSSTGEICGPTGNLECRGANTEEELQRQLDKLVAGIIALDADVVGIQEIENDIRDDDGSQAHDAVLKLVEALNADEGDGTWAWVGPADHYNDYPVRNELIYRTDGVTPVGDPVALEHEAFDSTRPGDIEPLGRPPLAQTFRQIVDRGSRQPFTVVVNHFKSKGSSCASIGDPDTGDGQANCNLTRVAQAEALLDFIDVLEEDSAGVLAIGDFNSYAMEDPIDTLEAGGLTDLVGAEFGNESYTFVFDGQLGTLDYILATRSMLNWVEGVTVFHINADEPDILDYDMSFKRPAQDALYEPLPYRVSDHDPVIVGLEFGGPKGR